MERLAGQCRDVPGLQPLNLFESKTQGVALGWFVSGASPLIFFTAFLKARHIRRFLRARHISHVSDVAIPNEDYPLRPHQSR